MHQVYDWASVRKRKLSNDTLHKVHSMVLHAFHENSYKNPKIKFNSQFNTHSSFFLFLYLSLSLFLSSSFSFSLPFSHVELIGICNIVHPYQVTSPILIASTKSWICCGVRFNGVHCAAPSRYSKINHLHWIESKRRKRKHFIWKFKNIVFFCKLIIFKYLMCTGVKYRWIFLLLPFLARLWQCWLQQESVNRNTIHRYCERNLYSPYQDVSIDFSITTLVSVKEGNNSVELFKEIPCKQDALQ